MKTIIGVAGLLIAGLTLSSVAKDREMQDAVQIRATLDLKDGSRLVGVPQEKSLRVTLDFMKATIPLEKIRQCEIRHKDERAVINLQNGDRLTGTPEFDRFKLETSMGRLSPEIAQIDRMTFSVSRLGSLPAGEGDIFFGGVNWHAWKTLFEVQGDKLVSLPKVRPGFNYGHNGSSRGPTLMSNIGNPDWKDYRVEFDYCDTGVDPSFNPYGLGLDYHDGAIFFHVADAKESWNECGSSLYSFNVSGDGTWQLSCVYNDYCRVPMGFGNPQKDGERKLASGSGLKPDRINGNHYRIEIRGQHIQIWVDDQLIVDLTDEKMDETIGGQTLDHGGVGFHWGLDSMGWIRNFSATGL